MPDEVQHAMDGVSEVLKEAHDPDRPGLCRAGRRSGPLRINRHCRLWRNGQRAQTEDPRGSPPPLEPFPPPPGRRGSGSASGVMCYAHPASQPRAARGPGVSEGSEGHTHRSSSLSSDRRKTYTGSIERVGRGPRHLHALDAHLHRGAREVHLHRRLQARPARIHQDLAVVIRPPSPLHLRGGRAETHATTDSSLDTQRDTG